MQIWVSLWAEAVGLLMMEELQGNGITPSAAHGGYRDLELGFFGEAEGRGKRPQTWAAARKLPAKLKKTIFPPSELFIVAQYPVCILGDLQNSVAKARVAKPGQPHLALQAAQLWQVVGGAQWLPRCCGSFSTLVPGIYRDLAPSLHHCVKDLSLKSLMYHQQVACVLSY